MGFAVELWNWFYLFYFTLMWLRTKCSLLTILLSPFKVRRLQEIVLWSITCQIKWFVGREKAICIMEKCCLIFDMIPSVWYISYVPDHPWAWGTPTTMLKLFYDLWKDGYRIFVVPFKNKCPNKAIPPSPLILWSVYFEYNSNAGGVTNCIKHSRNLPHPLDPLHCMSRDENFPLSQSAFVQGYKNVCTDVAFVNTYQIWS